MTRTEVPPKLPDPRQRYRALAEGQRVPETPFEEALQRLLQGDPAAGADDEAVARALQSYRIPSVRSLFDACLLAGGTPDELEEAFQVSQAEYAAYAHLFFDKAVFHNSFHVIAYIASLKDEGTRELLKEAHTQGFRALRYKYAGETSPPAPEHTVQRMLEADSKRYAELLQTPLTDASIKEVRALGKQVLAGALALNRISGGGGAGGAGGAGAGGEGADAGAETPDYVIQSGAKNPTLAELLAAGGEIAH